MMNTTTTTAGFAALSPGLDALVEHNLNMAVREAISQIRRGQPRRLVEQRLLASARSAQRVLGEVSL